MGVSLNDNIKRIEDAKVSIRNAIEAKGVAVPADLHLEGYAAKVEEITTSGTVSIDLSGTGWDTEPIFPVKPGSIDQLDLDLDYTRERMSMWNNPVSVFAPEAPAEDKHKGFFMDDVSLVYAPKVVPSGNPEDSSSVIESSSELFKGCSNLFAVPKLDRIYTSNSSANMFENCTLLQYIEEITYGAGALQNCSFMFKGCASLKYGPNMGSMRITDASHMFDGCNELTFVPCYDMSEATNMTSMFSGCAHLLEVPHFSTGKVTDMREAFRGCKRIKSIPQLNTGKTEVFLRTFFDAASLETIPLLDFHSAKTLLNTFDRCFKLKNLGGFSGLKVSISFAGCSKLLRTSVINVFNNLEKVTDNKTITLHPSVKSQLNPQDVAIATGKGWVVK